MTPDPGRDQLIADLAGTREYLDRQAGGPDPIAALRAVALQLLLIQRRVQAGVYDGRRPDRTRRPRVVPLFPEDRRN